MKSPRLLVLACTLIVMTAGAVVCAPASSARGATSGDDLRHPGRDWMGSQAAGHFSAADRQQSRRLARSSAAAVDSVLGLDVSSWQGNVNWASVAQKGAKFAIVKATESTSYRNPYFSQQYSGSYNAGLMHGAYHFATPDTAGGTSQARYFVAHGGGWSRDGRTLPGMLDIEWNPYGATCYGKKPDRMAAWIKFFSDEYHRLTTRWPMIYTATSWWNKCVGRYGAFASTNPLMLACYCSTAGTMPYNWKYQTIWQFADAGTLPGDQDRFNGDITRLRALANG